MNINKKTNKKGFTIVELVIVIAVIAILAAVLIPTFSSLVKTAQTSSDISLVKNLNTSLTTSEILDGKNETMTDALNDVKEDGYDVTKLTPTNSDNDILWHEESNRFVLRIKDKYESCGSGFVVDESKLYKLWKIYNEVEELESDPVYSIYWNADESLPEGKKLSVGFDAGTTKNVSEVIYENTSSEAKEVIIRTNTVNTTLTVNALTDTINHYGNVGKVDVVKVDMKCYNEYGNAAYVKVTEGKVVAKDGGKINILFINNSNSKNSVAIVDGGLIEQGYTLADDAGSSNIELSKTAEADAEEKGKIAIEDAAKKEAVENNPNGVAMTDNKVYDSVAEAIAATQSNEIIILRNADIKASDFVDKNITLIGNENVLTLVENSEHYIKTITTKGTLTIDLNGKSLNSKSNSVISVNEGTLTVIDKSGNNSGLINSNVTAIEVIGSSNLNVTSGTIKSTGSLFSSRSKIQYGAIKNSGSGIVNISGGTFNFSVDNGGCAMLNTGSGKIIANGITIGDSDYSNIGAIAANTGAGEVDLTNVTFYVVPNSGNPGAALLNMGSGIMNITNCTGHTQNGSMIADGYSDSFSEKLGTGIININGGTYTCTTNGGYGVYSVGNGTININGAAFNTSGADAHGIYVYGAATVNIENAIIDTQHTDLTQGNENMAGYVVYISSMGAGSGKVTIKSGNYKGYVESNYQVVKIDSGCSGYIKIEGGTFNAEPKGTHNVSSWNGSSWDVAYVEMQVIADGYHAVDNGNGTWSVVADE